MGIHKAGHRSSFGEPAWKKLSKSILLIPIGILIAFSLFRLTYYAIMDKAMIEYNEVYFGPAKVKLTMFCEKGFQDKSKFFNGRLEVEYYKLWYHDSRRARFGAAMMAPDYAWWHGFYEGKERFANYTQEINELIRPNNKAYIVPNRP